MSQTRVRIDIIERAVALACRAPSVHNSQPWRWVLEGADLRLFAATSRTVPFTDISGREAMMSCGAVLDHLRVAQDLQAIARFIDGGTMRMPQITRYSLERAGEALRAMQAGGTRGKLVVEIADLH